MSDYTTNTTNSSDTDENSDNSYPNFSSASSDASNTSPMSSQEVVPSQDSSNVQEVADNGEPQEEPKDVNPKEAPPKPSSAVQDPSSVPVAPPMPQERNADDLAYMQDVATKQIAPQTYEQLFANKSTLGKIGTLFGLLVGGAGSGLSHQPNQLMELMNKEIERDLNAQQNNKTNAQNFLAMSYQHELQQTQMAQAQAGVKASLAQTALANAQIPYLTAKNKMMASILGGYLPQIAGSNPKAQAVLNGIVPVGIQQMQQNNEKIGAIQSAQAQQNGQGNYINGVNIPKLNQLINIGKISPELPNVITDEGGVRSESSAVQKNRANMRVFLNAYNDLNNSTLAGELNPANRSAKINAVDPEFQPFLPSPLDYGKARSTKLKEALQKFQQNEQSTPTLDRFGLKSPFPFNSFEGQGNPQQAQPAPQAQPLQNANVTPSIKTINGAQYKKVAGGWQKVKTSNIAAGQ